MPRAYSLGDFEVDMRAWMRLDLTPRERLQLRRLQKQQPQRRQLPPLYVVARAAVWARAYWRERSTLGLSWPFPDFDIPPPAEPERRSRGRPPKLRVEAVYQIARQAWMYELGGGWNGWWRYRAAGPVWARENPRLKHLPLEPANAPAAFIVAFAKLVSSEIEEANLRAVHERVWRSLVSPENAARRRAQRCAKDQEPEVRERRLEGQRKRRAEQKRERLATRARKRAALVRLSGRPARPR